MGENNIGLNGIEFIEFSTTGHQTWLHELFLSFGFSRTHEHAEREVHLYQQNDIHFLLNFDQHTFGHDFQSKHGPSISSMGWRVKDAQFALDYAVSQGATAVQKGDYVHASGKATPAIYGIGESLIYFIDDKEDVYKNLGFLPARNPDSIPEKGFLAIDHLTNNVPKGTMKDWADFYKSIFGFTEVRYFDIRGAQTGLQSYALRSPCGKFCIPINEGTEEKSQINEYLREYKGPGVQHIAFLTHDLLHSLDRLEGSPIETLDIDDEYYEEVFDRVPNVKEDPQHIRRHNVLVDGDEEGYLLQIFTKNLCGPIFIELIQRNNHLSFGEGNFGALFRSIERDQQKRGVI